MFRPPKPISMTLNLAPMVDVMMCLIIFFLLATKLVSAQYRGVHLAPAAAAREIERSELGARVVVNVRPVPGDPASAEFVVLGWDGRQATERALPPADLAAYLASRAAAAAERGEQIRCVIRADREVAYRHVEQVLRGCGLAQIGSVVLSAKPIGEDES